MQARSIVCIAHLKGCLVIPDCKVVLARGINSPRTFHCFLKFPRNFQILQRHNVNFVRARANSVACSIKISWYYLFKLNLSSCRIVASWNFGLDAGYVVAACRRVIEDNFRPEEKRLITASGDYWTRRPYCFSKESIDRIDRVTCGQWIIQVRIIILL